MKTLRRASLYDIKRIGEAGELFHDPSAPVSVEPPGAAFWEKARLNWNQPRSRAPHI